MRLDKYLKVSRIIKRRTVANEACTGGRVSINGKTAKPGTEVKPGDVLSIQFGEHCNTYEILSVAETVKKEQADGLYRLIRQELTQRDENDEQA